MTIYIDEAMEKFPEDVTTSMVSPASEHRFNINKNMKRFRKERDILFHRLFAKLFLLENLQV